MSTPDQKVTECYYLKSTDKSTEFDFKNWPFQHSAWMSATDKDTQSILYLEVFVKSFTKISFKNLLVTS